MIIGNKINEIKKHDDLKVNQDNEIKWEVKKVEKETVVMKDSEPKDGVKFFNTSSELILREPIFQMN